MRKSTFLSMLFFISLSLVLIGLVLILTGCTWVSAPEVIMPEDPEYAILCEVEEPDPACADNVITIRITIPNPTR